MEWFYDWFYILVIAALAGPVSWALGWFFDFQYSAEGQKLGKNPAFIFLKNVFGFAAFVIMLLIASELFSYFGVTP